jgi:hypothetical protein
MRVIALLFILIGATSQWVAGQKSNEAGTAAAFRALEQECVVGQSRHDNRALDLIFDNALVYVEYCKLVTKGEYLSRIKQAGPQLNLVMEPMTVRAFGNTAIVVGTYGEKESKGGRPRLRRWRFLDIWVYKKNGWVLVAAAAAPLTDR